MAEEPPLLDFSEKNAFAVKTLKTRMPVILTKAVDFLHRHLGDAHDKMTSEESKGARRAIGLLTKLKYEMQTGKPMTPLTEEDFDSDLVWWRAERERHSGEDGDGPRWWKAPWLFSECYMYRLIRQACLSSPVLRELDYFRESKQNAYNCSLESIKALSSWVVDEATQQEGGLDAASRGRTFELLLQFSLWGNKSDLSLLADFDGSTSLDDMHAGSEEHLESLLKHILQNDTPAIWSHVSEARDACLHLVLDNSGFEVFTDLCLAHWLIVAGFYSKVVLHGKALPWFVSDVTKYDLDWLLEQLEGSQVEASQTLARVWRSYLDSSIWEYQAHPFWTGPCDYDVMADAAPDLYRQLSEAHLIVFKGDLNYRKLVGDLTWPVDTPFSTALRRFQPAPLCVMRTLKCNTLAGVSKTKAEEAEKVDPDWMVSGQFAVIETSL